MAEGSVAGWAAWRGVPEDGKRERVGNGGGRWRRGAR